MNKLKMKTIAINNYMMKYIKEYCDATGEYDAFVVPEVFVGNIGLLKGKLNVPHHIVVKINEALESKSLIRFTTSEVSLSEDSYFFDVISDNDTFQKVKAMADGEGYKEVYVRFYKLLNYLPLVNLEIDNNLVKVLDNIRNSEKVTKDDYVRLVLK